MKKCAECNKIWVSSPHPTKQGETICASCSNNLYFQNIANGNIIEIRIDATIVPIWYIEKIKHELAEFQKDKK